MLCSSSAGQGCVATLTFVFGGRCLREGYRAKKREALIGPIRKQVDQATFGERPLDAELHQLGYSIAREANSVRGANVIDH
jgi:hypothetical protein